MPLHQIYPPKDSNIRTDFDIVAVHGLNPWGKDNHAFRTWTTDSGRCWLKDDIPRDFPTARVFLYEYNTDPTDATGKQRLVYAAENLLKRIRTRRGEDDAKDGSPRPLIYVAHSLGGLLIETCLVQGKIDPQYEKLTDAVKGLIFFAVPHLGADNLVHKLGDKLVRIATMSGKDKSDYLPYLKEGSSQSDTLRHKFRHLLTGFPITSFYETLPYSKSIGLIVDRDSAVFNVANEEQIELEANHSDLCRFDTTLDDEAYAMTRDSLRKMYPRAGESLPVVVHAEYVTSSDDDSQWEEVVSKKHARAEKAKERRDQTRMTGRPRTGMPILPLPAALHLPASRPVTPMTIASIHSSAPLSRTSLDSSPASYPAPPTIFRITNLDLALNTDDIRKNLRSSGLGEAVNTDNIVSHAPHLADRQTAVVRFSPPPRSFPTTREAASPRPLVDAWFWASWGRLTPKVDAHFHGSTPVSSPRYGVDDLEVPASEHDSWIHRAHGGGRLHQFRKILIDIIVLSPPGEHAYEYWCDDRGCMWISDFLANEGIDGARILLFGSKQLPGEFSSVKAPMLKFLRGEDHPVIIVDFHRPQGTALSLELLDSPDKLLAGKLGLITVTHGQVSIEYGLGPIPLRRDVEDYDWSRVRDVFKFSKRDDSTYRKIVDSIWLLTEKLLYERQPTPSTSWYPNPWGATKPTEAQIRGCIRKTGPFQLLEDVLRNLHRSGAISTLETGREDPKRDRAFHGIVNDKYFRSWKQGGQSNGATGGGSELPSGLLRIVAPADWNLTTFCRVLPNHAVGYTVIHIDCQKLSETFAPGRCSWRGAALVSPLILRITHVVMDTWAEKDKSKTTAEAVRVAIGSLLENILLRSALDHSLDDISGSLVRALEHLGSNLVNVVDEVLRDCTRDLGHHSPLPSTSFVVAVDGLHHIQKSPEIGRMVHCLRKLQGVLAEFSVCKVLFTYEERDDLSGFLYDVPRISDKEAKKCLKDLEVPAQRSIEKRHDGTLDWFWEDEECNKWMSAETSALLCLWGKPACGKSILSRYILEQVKDAHRSASPSSSSSDEDDVICASFFFYVDRPELRTPRAMLQALLYDILNEPSTRRALYPHFQTEFLAIEERIKARRSCGVEEKVEWTEPELRRVLARVAQHKLPLTMYIVVDGLDEAEDPVSCAKTIVETLVEDPDRPETAAIRLKLLVATRPDKVVERNLKARFKSLTVSDVTLQARNNSDIHIFASSFLNTSLISDLGWTAGEVDKARAMLCDRAKGIFLWAKLAKGLISSYLLAEREASLEDFARFLGKIPGSIEKLYQKLLATLVTWLEKQPDRHELFVKVRRMFELVAQAQGRRALSVEEFRDAYVLPQGKTEKKFDLRRSRPGNLLDLTSKWTANFLEHYRESNSIDFLHPTAVQFLRKAKSGIGGKQMLELVKEPSEISTLGSACIQYLGLVTTALKQNAAAFSEGGTVDEFNSFVRTIDDFPFLVYILQHFHSHIPKDEAKSAVSPEVTQVVTAMLGTPILHLLRDWINERDLRIPFSLLTRIGKPQKAHKFQNSVLHCAAALGHPTAARIALAAGADIKSRSSLHESGEDALCLAIIHRTEGSMPVARILLDNRADPNGETRMRGTPLHYAGKYLREDMVQLLLNKQADVHAKDAEDMTPLHRTVIGLQEPPVREKDGTWRPSPVREASLSCAKLLVRGGASVRAVDRRGHTPIHWASGLRERLEFLRFLVEAGGASAKKIASAVNIRCQLKGSTPIQWASGHGNADAVRYLIDHGAVVEHADIRGKTAVRWAARYDKHEILALLLKTLREQGKDVRGVVNTQELGGRTPLIWAAKNGHITCVKLLIGAGAAVDRAEIQVNGMGGTPLSWAVTWGHAEVFDYLLEKGASIAQDRRPRGAAGLYDDHQQETTRPLLGWAAGNGNIHMFDKLQRVAWDQGLDLDPDEPDSLGNTPFILAAAKGHVHMLGSLYDLRNRNGSRSVNAHHANHEGNTALLLAAGWGQLASVKWLAQTAGLDVDHVNENGDTALHRAARYGRAEVIAYLLGRRARTDVRNNQEMLYTEVREEYQQYNDGLFEGEGGQDDELDAWAH